MNKPKIKLTGTDGNAFSILGVARRAAKSAGWTSIQIEDMMKEAMSGDYNNLLATVSKYFDVR
jgi:hypothetical protein